MDANVVVDLKSKSVLMVNSHSYSTLISDCRSILLSFEEAHFKHIQRETNFCSNILAKVEKTSLESFTLFVIPPTFDGYLRRYALGLL